MKKLTAMALALMVVSFDDSARADDTSARHALAERLLEAMQMEKQMEKSMEAMNAQIAITKANMLETMGQKPPAGTAPNTLSMMERMAEEMSYENIKNDYVAIYAEVFSTKELEGLIAFYESPIGLAWLDKQPDVMMRTAQIAQNKMSKLMPLMMDEMKKSMPPQAIPSTPPAGDQ